MHTALDGDAFNGVQCRVATGNEGHNPLIHVADWRAATAFKRLVTRVGDKEAKVVNLVF